jgi:hypothetical protein
MLFQLLDYRLENIGIESREVKQIFLSSKSCRLALGPTQFPIQSVPWIFARGQLAGHWPLTTYSVKVKNECSYTATPPHTYMAWTDTTAPLFHLLIFTKKLNETFCNFTHWQLYCCTAAILLHHSYTVAPQLYCCTTAILLHHSYTVAPQLYCCTTAVLFD